MSTDYPKIGEGASLSDDRAFRINAGVWRTAAAGLSKTFQGKPWPDQFVYLDLRYFCCMAVADNAAGRSPAIPSRRVLAARWNWSLGRVRTLMDQPERWCDAADLPEWRGFWAAHAARFGAP